MSTFLRSRALRQATSLLPNIRNSSSSIPPPSTSIPDEFIGGRAGVEAKRLAFENKYKQAVANKAKKVGLSVEELRKGIEEKVNIEIQAVREAREKKIELIKNKVTETNGKDKPTKSKSSKSSDTPIKPLEDILDLSKASSLTTSEISSLWTSYHQSKGFLSAAIPTETYKRMLKVAKQYPLFVLPLARDIVGDLPEGLEKGSKGAVEMHFLEWAFLPPPENISEPIPSPSTVLFTPLAEYKQRNSYAQPYLILTHYTDLSNSHKVILMRGEISENVAFNSMDAQVLSVRLQLFYNPTGLGGEIEENRKKMLKTFHEEPEKFDLDSLVATAWEI